MGRRSTGWLLARDAIPVADAKAHVGGVLRLLRGKTRCLQWPRFSPYRVVGRVGDDIRPGVTTSSPIALRVTLFGLKFDSLIRAAGWNADVCIRRRATQTRRREADRHRARAAAVFSPAGLSSAWMTWAIIHRLTFLGTSDAVAPYPTGEADADGVRARPALPANCDGLAARELRMLSASS